MNSPKGDTEKQTTTPQGLFPFQLVDIRLYEIKAEQCDPDSEKPAELPLSMLLHVGDEPPDAGEFSLLLTFETILLSDDVPECTIYLALEGHFEAVVDVNTIKPKVIQRFKSADAIILFWPYLRQTLHDLTNRMRLGIPPLPIIDPRALVGSPSGDDTEEADE